MTSKERIETVLAGKVPDKVPWVPLIGRYYVSSLPALGYDLELLAPEEKKTGRALKHSLNLAEIEAIRLAGGDILYRHVMAYTIESDGCTYFHQEDGSGVESGWVTPLGELRQRVEYHNGTDYIKKHMIETEDDLRRYIYLLESQRAEADYEDLREFTDYIADDGIATLTGPVTPIQQLLQFSMGVEKTTFAFFDYPQLIQRFLEAQQRLNLEIYRILAASGARVVITYEDTSTTVLSPDWYSQYEAPHLNEYSDIIQSSGRMSHIAHMCGKLSLLTDRLREDRYCGIDSVCPPTTGDLEPGDALKETGKLIIGGLEPAALVRMGPDEVYQYATEKLDQVARAGAFDRFMLCSGDSVAALTPVENLQAVRAAVDDYRIA